jgi:hypothetical protein
MRSLTALVEQWKREGVEVSPPFTAQEVRDTFAAVGSVATSDVVEMYTTLGGVFDGAESIWELWSLDGIRKENNVPSPFGILFSDYMISCWCYRLRPTSDDTSEVFVDYFDGKDPALIARNLNEFFDHFLESPLRLMNASSIGEIKLWR